MKIELTITGLSRSDARTLFLKAGIVLDYDGDLTVIHSRSGAQAGVIPPDGPIHIDLGVLSEQERNSILNRLEIEKGQTAIAA
jgi:hypothetical protein